MSVPKELIEDIFLSCVSESLQVGFHPCRMIVIQGTLLPSQLLTTPFGSTWYQTGFRKRRHLVKFRKGRTETRGNLHGDQLYQFADQVGWVLVAVMVFLLNQILGNQVCRNQFHLSEMDRHFHGHRLHWWFLELLVVTLGLSHQRHPMSSIFSEIDQHQHHCHLQVRWWLLEGLVETLGLCHR